MNNAEILRSLGIVDTDSVNELLACMNAEDDLNNTILSELKVGGSERYNKMITLFPVGSIPSPIRIPEWMFRHYKDDPDFNLDDIEKVAMAHVIHYSVSGSNTGYIECSGNIENWCKCGVKDAHNALMRLVNRKLITQHVLNEDDCMGHSRNYGYFVNFPYVRSVLLKYKTIVNN